MKQKGKETNAISHLQTKLFRSSISLIFIFTIYRFELTVRLTRHPPIANP